MNIKVISGGQTGVDRGALIAAKNLGIETGGWMTKEFFAHDGEHPEFAELYGMVETTGYSYAGRTAMNVKNSDGTIRIASNFESDGEVLTLKMLSQYKKPCLDINVSYDRSSELEYHTDVLPEDVADWIISNNIKVLNIAGNSERSAFRITRFATDYIGKFLTIVKNAN